MPNLRSHNLKKWERRQNKYVIWIAPRHSNCKKCHFFFYIKIKVVHTSTFLGIGNSRINHWGLHPLFCKEPWMCWAPGLCSHLPVTTVHLKEGGSLSIFFPLCQAWSWGLSLRVLESQGRHPDSATLGSLCTWAQTSATPGMLFAQTFQGTISPRLRTALSS